jgi:hypothetical protein
MTYEEKARVIDSFVREFDQPEWTERQLQNYRGRMRLFIKAFAIPAGLVKRLYDAGIPQAFYEARGYDFFSDRDLD